MVLVETSRADAERRIGQRILMLWILLYDFVGTQMTWRLSPFIGNPGDLFCLLKPSRDNFSVHVIQAVQASLKIPARNVEWLAPVLSMGLCLVTLGGLAYLAGPFIRANSRRKALVE